MRSSFRELDSRLWSEIVDCKVVAATEDAVRHSFSHSTEANETDSHDRSLFESAGARLFTANYRPVLVAVVMRDRRQQSITKRVSAWERYARHFRSSHDEAKILEAQQCCESNLVVGFIDHDLAVDFVSRRSEEAFGHDFIEDLRDHTILSHQRKSFGHRTDRAAQHEVVCEFRNRSMFRFVTALKSPACHNLK